MLSHLSDWICRFREHFFVFLFLLFLHPWIPTSRLPNYFIKYHQASRRDLETDNQICTCFLLSYLARGGWPTSQAKLNLLSKVVQDSATSYFFQIVLFSLQAQISA